MIRCTLPLVLMLLTVTSSSEAQTEIDVMSFNVRFGTANDGRNGWVLRKDTLVNAINEYSPDLLGTQEILTFQAEYIQNNVPGYRWIGVRREEDGMIGDMHIYGEMCAIFYDERRFYPVQTETFWLSDTPDIPGSTSWGNDITRIVTWAKFWDLETEDHIYFVNTHFDHRSQNSREQSTQMMIDRMAAFEPGVPIIITGDFNAHASSNVIHQTFEDAGYADVWLTAEEQAGPAVTWNAFGPPDPNSTARIDWILYRGDALEPAYAETVTYNEDGRYPSDHLPVYARFALTDDSPAKEE